MSLCGEGKLKIVLKRWYGLLEIYIVVAKWRPWYRKVNLVLGRPFRRCPLGLLIIDKEFAESCELMK